MPHKQPTPDSQDLKHLASKREVFWQSHRLDKTALTDRAIWCLTVCGGRGGGGAGTAFFFFPFSLEMQGSSSEYNYPHRTCPGSPILSLTQDTELSRWGPRLEGLLWEVTRLRDVLISPWETNLDTSITWGGMLRTGHKCRLPIETHRANLQTDSTGALEVSSSPLTFRCPLSPLLTGVPQESGAPLNSCQSCLMAVWLAGSEWSSFTLKCYPELSFTFKPFFF